MISLVKYNFHIWSAITRNQVEFSDMSYCPTIKGAFFIQSKDKELSWSCSLYCLGFTQQNLEGRNRQWIPRLRSWDVFNLNKSFDVIILWYSFHGLVTFQKSQTPTGLKHLPATEVGVYASPPHPGSMHGLQINVFSSKVMVLCRKKSQIPNKYLLMDLFKINQLIFIFSDICISYTNI